MQVISHRGLWLEPPEKNLESAFVRSFESGFGTETDLRDAVVAGASRIVISHDPPRGGEMVLEDFLALAARMGAPQLALNIKSDGLAAAIQRALDAYQYRNYFLFDNAVPDLLQCARAGLRCYTRISEYEQTAPLYDHPNVVGVWIDCFLPGRWYDEHLVRRILSQGKSAALVSPDLHGRLDELDGFLNWIVASELSSEKNLMICTDHPIDARNATGSSSR